MLQRTYPDQVCSIARALEVVGERWSLLVLREAFLGVRRYEDFLRGLGAASNVLSARLHTLCEHGVLERRRYQERPARFEYVLTAKGRELLPVIAALMQWGDRHYAEQGPPRLLLHAEDGGAATATISCDACGRRLDPADVEPREGPGLRGATTQRR